MSQPLLDFVHKIARDDAALRRFVADPAGDPDAAALTSAQKTALVSGDFAKLKAALIAENPSVAAQEDAKAKAAQAAAPLIGWNMAVLEGKIQVLKAPAP
jgi:hypothetical protein